MRGMTTAERWAAITKWLQEHDCNHESVLDCVDAWIAANPLFPQPPRVKPPPTANTVAPTDRP